MPTRSSARAVPLNLPIIRLAAVWCLIAAAVAGVWSASATIGAAPDRPAVSEHDSRR